MNTISGANPIKTARVFHISWALHPYEAKGYGPSIASKEIPKALCRHGIKAQVIVPGFAGISRLDSLRPTGSKLRPVQIGGNPFEITVKSGEVENLNLVSIGNPELLNGSLTYDQDATNLWRMVFFAKGALRFLQEQKPWPDVIACHDWPTALIPAYLNEHRNRIFPGSPTPFTIYYSYDPANLGAFDIEDSEAIGMDIENFCSQDIITSPDHFSLLKMGHLNAEEKRSINNPNPNPDEVESWAREEISLYRKHLHYYFTGMTEATKGTESTWQVLTPAEQLAQINPYVAGLFSSDILTPEQKQDVLKVLEEGQGKIFRKISNHEELALLLKDIRRIDWDEIKKTGMIEKVVTLHQNQTTGQVNGEVTLLSPQDDLVQLPPEGDEAIAKLGRDHFKDMIRLTIAGGVSLPFFGTTGSISLGTLQIPMPGGEESSFFGVEAKDIREAQTNYDSTILWYILIPEGDLGGQIRNHFTSHEYFGLKPEQINFFEQKGVFPTFTPEGEIFMDFSEKRIAFMPRGHGEVFKTFRESGLLEKALKSEGKKYVFASFVTNLGADIKSDLFLRILGAHIRSGREFTAEMVEPQIIDAGGIAVAINGRQQIKEFFTLPAKTEGEAQMHGTPLFSGNFVANLEALQREFALPYWIKRKIVKGFPYYKMGSFVGDAAGDLNSQLLFVPRNLRYIVAPNPRFLKEAAEAYAYKELWGGKI